MQYNQGTLEDVGRGGEAVFATDASDRIILWNKECESLLGVPARRAVGKPCYEVVCGRDGSGNRYCHRNCAVAYQAREKKDEPVHPFPLSVKMSDGTSRRISSSLFTIPSYHKALATLVHVLRPATATAAPVPAFVPEPLEPMADDQGNIVSLTLREREILGELARGASTPSIAKKLGIAAVTVRNHIQSILQKLEVHSKLEAVVLAHKRQLI